MPAFDDAVAVVDSVGVPVTTEASSPFWKPVRWYVRVGLAAP